MNYYYLAAILPTLTFGDPPGLSVDEFTALCAEHLTGRDFLAVKSLLAPGVPSARHPFVREWRLKELQLRNAVVKARAARLGRDGAPYLHEDAPYGTTAEKAVAEAFPKSPLAREQALDMFRWQTIEEMAGFDPFTSRALLAYALKFRICTRWAAMNRERGEDEANTLINRKEQT